MPVASKPVLLVPPFVWKGSNIFSGHLQHSVKYVVFQFSPDQFILTSNLQSRSTLDLISREERSRASQRHPRVQHHPKRFSTVVVPCALSNLNGLNTRLRGFLLKMLSKTFCQIILSDIFRQIGSANPFLCFFSRTKPKKYLRTSACYWRKMFQNTDRLIWHVLGAKSISYLTSKSLKEK